MTADSVFTHSRAADSPCRVELLALVEEGWAAFTLPGGGIRPAPYVSPAWFLPVALRCSAELGSGDLQRRARSCCPGRDCRVHKLHSSVA